MASPAIGRHEAAGWLAAGLVALSLHAGILWAAQRADEDERHGNLPEAVMIELAPLPAEPEPIRETVAEVPEPADPAPPVEPEEQVQDDMAEAPVPDPEPAPQPTPEPEAEPAPQPEPKPDPVQEEIAEAPEPQSQPVPQPQSEPVQPEEAPAPAEVAAPEAPAEPDVANLVTPEENVPLPSPRPEPRLEPEPTPEKRAAKKPARAEEPVRKAAQKTPAPAAKAASARADQARPKASAAAPSPRRQAPAVSPARWQSKLVSFLNRHKRYPRAARSRKEEGTAQLAFTIDASGRVLAARIARSSGSTELDNEVLSMIRRASPLPAPPAAIARSRMNLSVPISFKLR